MAYRSPGVRIEDLPNQALAAQPGGVRIPAVVGTGATTTLVPNVPLTKGTADGTDTIVNPLNTTVLEVTAISDVPGLSQYKQGTDFTIINNNIVWAPAGSEPSTGATYYVSYTKAKPSSSYNTPDLWFSLKDVRDAFGPELKNGIVNPITNAAAMAFRNGAASVMIVQATTGSNTDLQTAIDALQLSDIDVIVAPQATNSTLQNYLKTHVITQSAPSIKHERMAVMAPTLDGLSPSISEQTGRADGMADRRIVLVSPPAVILTLKDSATNQDTDVLVSSGYAAAGFAGLMTNANFDPAEPLTRKSVSGLKTLSNFNYLPSQMDVLAARGITVLESINDAIRVRHALTTGTGNINDLTVSVVLIIDNIRKDVRSALEREFIGTKILASTPSAVATKIKALLDTKVNDKIIVDYDEGSIAVTQDLTDPRTLKVSFAVAPVYPLEFIDVVFSLFVAA